MLKPLRDIVAKKQLLWQKKALQKSEVIDVASQLASIRTLLILMPEKLDDFGIALNKVRALRSHFPDSKLFAIVRSTYANFVTRDLFEQAIFLGPQELSVFGLPNRPFIRTLMKLSYDLVIDFNDEFDIVSTYLCSCLSAKVRVCLAHPNRDPFYNLQIRTKDAETLDKKINTLLKYLSILTDPSASLDKKLIPA